MKKMQSGFTLIELVVVIVILGILAAVAIPKFVDLSDEANAAAVQGVAGSLSSAMAINYAGCVALNNTVTPNKCVKVSGCADAAIVLNGGLPTGYSAAVSGAAPAATNGTPFSCTISKTGTAATAVASGIVAGQ